MAAGIPAVLGLLLAISTMAWADPQGPAIQARRTPTPIKLDGKLDDPQWAAAVPYDHFIENFPREGAPVDPAFRTEVRVLYDDTNLYLGVRSYDPQPRLIQRQLSRRDTLPTADFIELALDPTHQGRTGYDFIVNAAGVLRDALLYGNFNSTDTWDAVWDAASAVDDRGWTAEYVIPLRVLRFPQARNQTWGILVRRVIPRTHQTLDSTRIPRNANPVQAGGIVVSLLGPLVDLIDLQPKRDVELAPYAAARLSIDPQFSDPARPQPTLLNPSVDLGLDAKTALTSDLTLSVTVNPDFGQVEADQVIQNTSTAEAFFPEKRPFFTQGLDLFQAVGSEYGSPQQMFYSRRIGLNAPILGAAKLTGTVREGLELGVLDALVMGAGNPSLVPVGYTTTDPAVLAPFEASPDRRWQFHWTQPFHLGPNNILPNAHPVTTNYFAIVARQQLFANSTVGATFTSALPLEAQCVPSEFSGPFQYSPSTCASSGGNAAAVDWNLRDKTGEWGFFGQLDASEEVGGPPEGTVLADGTVLKNGDLGYGFYFRGGKLGGEPFRFDVNGVLETAKLNLNHVGFQSLSNYQWYDLNLHYVRPSGIGIFRTAQLDYNLDLNWSADGRWIPRGINTNVHGSVQLPSYDSLGMQFGLEMPQFDTREIFQAGVPFERMTDIFLAVGGGTDSNRPYFFNLNLVGFHGFAKGPVRSLWGWAISGNATWRPLPYLESYVAVDTARKPQGARYVATNGDQAVFGFLDPAYFSVTFRQQLVLTPTLTLQAYAQLFSGVERYGPFYAGALNGREVLPIADIAPIDYPIPPNDNPNNHSGVLNINVVLRWEYRLGSTLFLVYTRSQQELLSSPPSLSTWPSSLGTGPVSETFMAKWSYFWDV